MQNPVIGNLNSEDGMEHKQRRRFRDETNYVEVVGISRFRQVLTRRAVEFLQGLPHVPKQGVRPTEK